MATRDELGGKPNGVRVHLVALLGLPAGLIFCFAVLFAPASYAQQTKNSCLDCHAQLDPPLHVSQDEYSSSIHAQKGITCVTCHGGDATTDDVDKSMSAATEFKGHLERKQIPACCAKCHADASYMRGFNPSLRTDQFAQYLTSAHGKLLAKGDTKVAVCIDCHGVHDIQPPNDPRARVYPTNVAQTCATCHANADYMKGYKIPTDQFARYNTSVHHSALVDRGDLSAPTCTTCHGSHGAAPPGVSSVENVCSTCHVFQAQLFDSGPHKDAFASLGLPGCITCHSNHGIQHPSDALLGTADVSVCVKCHSAGEPGFDAAAKMHENLAKLDTAIGRSDAILNRAELSGMEVGAAKLDQSDARDDLIKARVAIHSVQPEKVGQDVQAGLAVAEKTYQAGLAAMAERSYRRTGLFISLGITLIVLVGIALLIRRLESGSGS
ncbi:MAG TPA: cytochrome c3 family protein [Candidatus Acidoferrales bacterium]|nr:cytochrome c3 family protein [Candidatus Acidoferrales bacterium]